MNRSELHEYLLKYTPIEFMSLETYNSRTNPLGTRRFNDNSGHSFTIWNNRWNNVQVVRHSRYYPHSFHQHDYIEIMYLYSGAGENLTETNSTRLIEGDLCFITPGAWHLPYIEGDNLLLNFCVRTNWLTEHIKRIKHSSSFADYLKSLNEMTRPKYLLVKSHTQPEIIDCAERLIAASLVKSEDAEYEQECIFEELLLKTNRLCGDSVESGELFSTYELNSKIISIISSDYRTLTLEELADRLSYSKSHICRVIHQGFGTTFSDIINQLRISDACHMLKSSGLTISEIAFSCGFSSIEYFTRTFRRYMDVPPSEYRKSGSFFPEPPSRFHFKDKLNNPNLYGKKA